MSTFKYALRYAPLLVLTFILIPAFLSRLATDAYSGSSALYSPDQQTVGFPFDQAGTLLYDIIAPSLQESWAVGGTFTLNTDEQYDVQQRKPVSGLILHYTSKTGWRLAAKTPLPLFSVSFGSDRDGWAVGYGGALVHYDGTRWTPVTVTGLKGNLNGVAMTSARDGWAVGQDGLMLHYDGHQWSQRPTSTIPTLNSITMLSPDEGWAVGEWGTILHYHNQTWTITQTDTATLHKITMLSADEGWAVGTNNTVLHYRSGTWNRVCTYNCIMLYEDSISDNNDIKDIAMDNPQHGWIIYRDQYQSGLWEYKNEVWQTFVSNHEFSDILYFTRIVMTSDDTGWALGQGRKDSFTTFPIIFRYRNHYLDKEYQYPIDTN